MKLLQINSIPSTPIQKISLKYNNNDIYVKRDDLIPFSFGGNKARKAELFFREILSGDFDTVVTYGSSSSNHCRVVSNMCAKFGLDCYIVSPQEDYKTTFNSRMVEQLNAKVIKAPIESVATTIESLISELSKENSVYFIPGGGHGNIGTSAYVQAYDEIYCFEAEKGIAFDYIFLASGTGTTQAGLICGNVLKKSKKKIVGISIARTNPRGSEVIAESVEKYLQEKGYRADFPEIIFDDSYICGGYGKSIFPIDLCIEEVFAKEGIPLNRTYTGKAFWGMTEYLKKHDIKNKNILFLHTGGEPLFFDDLGE